MTNCGRIKSRSFSYPGLSTSATETYTYDDQGLLKSMTMVDWRTISLKYDGLDRLEKREIAENGLVTQTYAYAPGSQSGTTSTRVKTYESKYNGGSKVKYAYTYYDNGNIKEQKNLLDSSYWRYTYDPQGQMTFATSYASNGVAKARYKYAYDAAGNLQSWQVNNDDNSKILESHTYTYGDTNWKDLLTAFDGKPITYDAIGNPTKYYDGSTMVWTEGRRLKSITKDGQTSSFLYDANGQRLQKTNPDGSYTKYCILDGRVIGEIIYKKTANGVKWSHGVRYIYGDDGSVIGFGIWDANTQNEWERYYFIKNVQGDVLHVYREADNKLVASYDYDPFGKATITHSVDEVAEQNPFRYRGYYYDTETGFYYLNSRYYDPQTCRFINADRYTSTGQGIVGCNMYAYCVNNPIAYSDSDGNSAVIFPLIENGLNLPASGGYPVEINGITYYYATDIQNGELYEYWFNSEGDLVWIRHNSDHNKPWCHKKPHDHKGGKDKDGNNTIEKGVKDVNEDFHSPDKFSIEQNGIFNDETTKYVAVGVSTVVAYEFIKWAVATTLAPATGGASFVAAAVTP